MFFKRQKLIFCFIIGIILFIPAFTQAVWSNTADFYVESDYDLFGRNKIEAQLIKTTNKIYFYADKDWYNSFSQKNELDNKIYNLSSSFEYNTYPNLVNLLGSEDNPGVDNNSRIVVVLEPLKKDYGGYVRTGDHYHKEDFSLSNQGQIIFLNANLINESTSDFLNYEFDVLISTTIIETGLDIPRVNTILINDADNFGLPRKVEDLQENYNKIETSGLEVEFI